MLVLHQGLIGFRASTGSGAPARTRGRLASLALLAVCVPGCGPTPLDPVFGYLADTYQSFWAPSESMFPTVLVGDHMFARKAWRSEPPSRGDLIVYRAGRLESGGKCALDRCETEPVVEVYLARLVGLPGDVVAVEEGGLVLNGDARKAPGPALCSETTHAGGEVAIHRESLGGRDYEIAVDPARSGVPARTESVEEGRYFVLGDYRSNSFDSRYHGSIPVEDVVAGVASIYWSRAPGGPVRWERIGLQPE